MPDLYGFIAENALLCVAFALVLILFLKSEHEMFSGVSLIEPQDVAALVNEGAELYDLRDEADFKKGHITHAKPFALFSEDAHGEDAQVILYVQKGSAAQKKAMMLRSKQNKAKFFVLQDGLDAWVAAGFPLVQSGKE
jgi:rhodanese-related sulfurtransferase